MSSTHKLIVALALIVGGSVVATAAILTGNAEWLVPVAIVVMPCIAVIWRERE